MRISFSSLTASSSISSGLTIYLAIVLETFFSSSGGTDALTHKLRCRVPNLLASTYLERREIYDNVNGFCKVRSKILHGRHTERFDDLYMIGEYVRSSINRILKIVDKLEPKNFEEQYDALLTRLDLSDDI